MRGCAFIKVKCSSRERPNYFKRGVEKLIYQLACLECTLDLLSNLVALLQTSRKTGTEIEKKKKRRNPVSFHCLIYFTKGR